MVLFFTSIPINFWLVLMVIKSESVFFYACSQSSFKIIAELCLPSNELKQFIYESTVNRNNIPSPPRASLQTCVTGTVNYEMGSEQVSYDDSHQETCEFGHNKCYTQTMVINSEGWQGMVNQLNSSI